MIYEHFRVTGAHEQIDSVSLHKATTFKILIQDGVKFYCLLVKCPKIMFWKVCTRCEYA